MKTMKYLISIVILSLATFNSCLVDKTTPYDDNEKGKNVAGFDLTRTSVAGIADGTEYTFPMKVKIVGPTVRDLSNDVTLIIAPDTEAMSEAAAANPKLTPAIQGTHFKITNPQVVLTKADNYLGTINITMTTAGLVTPLAKSPILILKTVSATGDDNVTNNGKKLEVSMNFACYSEFQGSYTVTINRVSTTGAASTIVRTDETFTKIGVETYRTKYVGHWTPAQLAPGTPGFTFLNSCNELIIPEQNLADYWANMVNGMSIGKYDPVAGTFYMEYTVCYPPGTCNTYKCTYVKN
jgi:hypothetical protein